MICPVEMTDHTSSLIAADWYEEQGQQGTADEIRHRNRPLEHHHRIDANTTRYSGSGSRVIGDACMSYSGTSTGAQGFSYCQADSINHRNESRCWSKHLITQTSNNASRIDTLTRWARRH